MWAGIIWARRPNAWQNLPIIITSPYVERVEGMDLVIIGERITMKDILCRNPTLDDLRQLRHIVHPSNADWIGNVHAVLHQVMDFCLDAIIEDGNVCASWRLRVWICLAPNAVGLLVKCYNDVCNFFGQDAL